MSEPTMFLGVPYEIPAAFFAARERAIERLIQRVIYRGCPAAADDMLTVLWSLGMECVIVYPVPPEQPYAVVTKGDVEIDRELLPRIPPWRDSVGELAWRQTKRLDDAGQAGDDRGAD